jgi:hypothetical protein
MKLSKSQVISLKVTMLFTIAIFSTFIGEHLHSFLGDWSCTGTKTGAFIAETQSSYSHYELTGCDYGGKHLATLHWGYRHWIYLTMCGTLFVIQVLDILNRSISANVLNNRSLPIR